MPSASIRPYIDQLSDKHIEAVHHLDCICAADAGDDTPCEFDAVKHLIRSTCNFCYGAFIRGHLLGFAMFRMDKDELFGLALMVHPDHRGHGIGRGLLRYVQKRVRDCAALLLRVVIDVHERNMTAQKFLRACGVKAKRVMRRAFGEDDGYRFVWRKD